MGPTLTGLAGLYSQTKQQLATATGSTEDLLHVHAGLLIFVLAALVLRKRMRSPLPISLVVLFAGLNEVVDWTAGKPVWSGESILDFSNTVVWPAVLFALARRWPAEWRRPA